MSDFASQNSWLGSPLVSLFRRLGLLAGLLLPISAFAQGGPPAMPVSISPPIAKRVTQWDVGDRRFHYVIQFHGMIGMAEQNLVLLTDNEEDQFVRC